MAIVEGHRCRLVSRQGHDFWQWPQLAEKLVPDIDLHIHVVVAVVIFLSLLPGIISFVRAKLQQRTAASASS